MSDIPDLPPVLERLLRPGFHAQIGAYALGSLPADERVAFEAHLRECVECQAELPILMDAARALRRAIVPDAEPVPVEERPSTPSAEPVNWISTRRALIGDEARNEVAATETAGRESEAPPTGAQAAVTGSAELTSETASPDEPDAAAEIDGTEPEEIPADGVESAKSAIPPAPFESGVLIDLPDEDAELIAAAVAAPPAAEAATARRRRPKGRIARGARPVDSELAAVASAGPPRLPWILGGLGLLAGVVAIIAALALAESNGNLKEEITVQNALIDDLNAQRDAYLAQTTAITWELQPTTLGTPGSGGTVFADPAGRSALLSVFGMPALGADQKYQVWYVLPDDSSVIGPALTLDANGTSVVPLTPDLSPYRAVAVTVEPAAGSELPSTNPVLQGFFTPPS